MALNETVTDSVESVVNGTSNGMWTILLLEVVAVDDAVYPYPLKEWVNLPVL